MKERKEMDSKYFWDLSLIYKSNDELEADLKKCEDLKSQLVKLEGSTMNSSDDLYNTLLLSNELKRLLYKVYMYCFLKLDEDQTNGDSLNQMNKTYSFIVSCDTVTSYIEPEILAADESLVRQYITENVKLSEFERVLEIILKNKKYIKTSQIENILSQTALLTSASTDIFSALVNVDLVFNDVKDSEGNDHQLSEASWISILYSSDRVLRENAFKEFYRVYGSFNNTFTSIFVSYLKTKQFSIGVRGYKDPLSRALESNEVNVEIYYNLIESVRKNFDTNHRYVNLRKRILGVDELHLYDTYVPLISSVDRKYTYNEATEIVTKSLSILGDDYINVVKAALNDGWIDVFPNKGKRGGAYSFGSYDTVPYILLNYTETINDVFTLAHEIGHSVHTYMSNKHQTFQDSSYKIFVAEIASTVNEFIMINDLLEQSDNDEMTKYLLTYKLEQFRSTVYRQTMFAEFELKSNEVFFKNQTVSSDELNDMYLQLNKDYFGSGIVCDEQIKYEWSRIPHFYSDFYVYQYATSLCIATYVVDQILSGNIEMKEKYLNFLTLGNSMTPVEIVKTLGVDVSKGDVFEYALQEYKKTLEKLEALCE